MSYVKKSAPFIVAIACVCSVALNPALVPAQAQDADVKRTLFEDANKQYLKNLEEVKKAHGSECREYAHILDEMASNYTGQAQYAESERLHKQAIDIFRKLNNEEDLAHSLNLLLVLYMMQNRMMEAQAIAEEDYRLFLKTLGPEDKDTARAQKHLGMVYAALGRNDEAEKLLLDALHLREKILDPKNPSLATSYTNVAVLKLNKGDCDEALVYFRKALKIREEYYGSDSDKSAETRGLISQAILQKAVQLKRLNPPPTEKIEECYAEAERELKLALAASTKASGPDYPTTIETRELLSDLYARTHHFDKSEEMALTAFASEQRTFGVARTSVSTRLFEYARPYWEHLVFARIDARHKALSKKPDAPVTKTQALEQKGNFEQAIKSLQGTSAAQSLSGIDLFEYQWLLADMHCRKGDYAAAEKLYMAASKTAEHLKLSEAVQADFLEASILNKQIAQSKEQLIPSYLRMSELRGEDSAAPLRTALTYLDRCMRFKQLNSTNNDFAPEVSWALWDKFIKADTTAGGGHPAAANTASTHEYVKNYGFDASMCLAYILLNGLRGKSAVQEPAAAAALLADRYAASPYDRTRRLLSVVDLVMETTDYGTAQQLISKAQAQSELSGDQGLICDCLLSHARLAMDQGDYETADKLSEKAAAISKNTSGKQAHRVLELVCEIASRAGSVQDSPTLRAKALESAQQLLRIKEKDGAPAADRALLLITIGRLFQSQQRTPEALQSFTQARLLCEGKADAESQLTWADALTELAVLQFLDKNYAAARQSIAQAYQIHKGNNARLAIAEQVRDLDLVALIDAAAGDAKGAHAEALQSAGKLDQYIQNVVPELSFAEQRAFLNNVYHTSTTLMTVCQDEQSLPAAYTYLLRWKGLLVEGLRRQNQLGDAASKKQFAHIVSELQAVRQQIATISRGKSAAPKDNTGQIESLTNRKEELERQLPGLKDAAENITVTGFQQLLADNEVLVDVQMYRALADGQLHYAAIITGKQDNPKFIELGEVFKVNQSIRSWRNSGIYAYKARDIELLDENDKPAQTSAENAEQSWSFLKSTIWTPISSALPPAATRILICEDGDLSKLPWNMFTILGDQKNLLLCHIDSPRELIALRKAVDNKKQAALPILIAGAITYKNPRLQLPGAKEEVSEIEHLAVANGIAANIMTAAQPTKHAVVGKLSGSSTVHLATHGFFLGGEDASVESTRGLGTRSLGTRSTGSGAPPAANRNPLVLSGVILASSPEENSKDESRLTAEELVGIDLSKCDLVTLSACDTGRGQEVTGQGVMGLRAAIMGGGARSVLLSLWPVDDQATRALMRHFYTNLWQKKMSKAEALKQAQIAVKTDSEHPEWSKPAYWSGWQLVGEGWK